jgi:ribonuclease P protein component
VKRKFRLRRQGDFQALVKGRRLYLGESLVAFSRRRAGDGAEGGLRVGVAVSRRLKGSVLRNRARRRLREAARLQLLAADLETQELGIPVDVVLIARPAALTLPAAALQADVSAVRGRLARGSAAAGAPQPEGLA